MDWIPVGTLTKTHGLKGEFKFHSLISDPNVFEGLKRVRVFGPEANEKELIISSFRWRLPRSIVKFEEYNSIDEVRHLAGWQVFVHRIGFKKLPEGEYYWFEIEGLNVFDEEGCHYGRIEEIIQTGSNDVYVVREGGKELLLPMIDSVVKTINLEEGKLIFHPVEGLLENAPG